VIPSSAFVLYSESYNEQRRNVKCPQIFSSKRSNDFHWYMPKWNTAAGTQLIISSIAHSLKSVLCILPFLLSFTPSRGKFNSPSNDLRRSSYHCWHLFLKVVIDQNCYLLKRHIRILGKDSLKGEHRLLHQISYVGRKMLL
jgi:hypothetical protein